jgi:pimeloyl-ACP methyl ester carboxylesterase
VPPLVAAGYRVVGFDLPAHGRSDGDQTNLLEIRDALLEVGRRHGPFAGVIAHSMGGAAAAMAVAAGLEARRLVLISTPTSLLDQTRRFGETLGISASLFDRFTARIEARLRTPLDRIELGAIAEAIDAPTLLVHDRGDDEVPYDNATRAARLLARARLHTTEGLGHRKLLRDEQVVASVTEFLTGQPPLQRELSTGDELERQLFDRDTR